MLTLKEKLLKYHEKLPNGCWRWTRSVSSSGYGFIQDKGIQYAAHRASMMIFKPLEYKTFLMVLHKCNYPRCINPDHLYCGTGSDNQKDSVKSGTHGESSKTYCVHGHEYTAENTYIVPSTGYRECRKCRQINEFTRIRS